MIFNLMWRRCAKAIGHVYEYAWATLLVLIALLYGLGYLTMYYAGEANIVDNYTWWFSVTITTVGYGDYSPVTSYGRFTAGLIIFFGIGAIGIVIGKISESIMGFANKNSKGLRNMNHQDHTLIMGYQQGSTEKIIDELLSNNTEEKIILCSFTQKENPLRHENVSFVVGELASDDVMRRSSAGKARNVIIHGADDSETFIAAYSFRVINKSAHMVCYLNNEDHSVKVNQLAAIDPSLNQVILPSNVYLMAQEIQDRESSGVVQQLVSNFSGDNLYRVDVHERGVCLEFQTLFIEMKKRYGAIVLAIKDQDVTINPDLSFTVKSGMAIFYAAPKRLVDIDFLGMGFAE